MKGKLEGIAQTKKYPHISLFLVHKKIGLSPGEFTRRRAILNDIIRATKRALTNTREIRRRVQNGSYRNYLFYREKYSFSYVCEYSRIYVKFMEKAN